MEEWKEILTLVCGVIGIGMCLSSTLVMCLAILSSKLSEMEGTQGE